ncbi:hypothetical protein DCC39_10935 [Pueribacillus theae]|uniref:ATPase n=1 Tax=Pueribacillus theae TaxID=2171751 RepID=A0A2U1K0A2_9BACI|nr:PRK06851 family protein [Pueribacillus theae]PWA10675.1 hypothetical protein DCC39_10935 [Pueribacillus theae]
MKGKITNYFAGGNTSVGFYSLFSSNLNDLKRLFILKGGPGTGKSFLIKTIGKEWVNRGYDIEYMYCSSDKESVDGVIIQKLKTGIVDGTNPHVIEPRFPGVIDDYVNLGVAWDAEKLRKNKEDIIDHTEQVSAAFKSAYEAFGDALIFHNERKKRLSPYIDRKKMEVLVNELIATFFKEKKESAKPHIKHRFHGANTPTGTVDFISELTSDVGNRYLLKGRPGVGKSTLLKSLASAAENRGFDTEIYHCEFEPERVDLLVVKELDLAIFDSTPPHEYAPERKNDKVIDLESEVLVSDVSEKDSFKIQIAEEQFAAKMKEGLGALAHAKALRDTLEGYYIHAMDFTITGQIRKEIDDEIKQIAKEKGNK